MVDVVIDTVVFVRSLINPRSIWGELVFRRRDHYRLVTSEAVTNEILEVIQRPEITKRFKFVAGADSAAIQYILGEARVVEPVELPWSGRDPKDDVFIATAVAAEASFLVSEDRDLLDIGAYEGIEIVDTAMFLQKIDG